MASGGSPNDVRHGRFAAIALVSLQSVSPAACAEGSAADVPSTRVAGELSCTMGRPEVVAGSPLGAQVGSKTSLSTLCRRVRRDGAIR